MIKSKIDKNRGDIVQCGDIIQLKHVNTEKFLHSHRHLSPLSQNQEISCFEGIDEGNDWKVNCEGNWGQEDKISFLHVPTENYMKSSSRFVFSRPISGQMEVYGAAQGPDAYWIAMEGVYF